MKVNVLTNITSSLKRIVQVLRSIGIFVEIPITNRACNTNTEFLYSRSEVRLLSKIISTEYQPEVCTNEQGMMHKIDHQCQNCSEKVHHAVLRKYEISSTCSFRKGSILSCQSFTRWLNALSCT